MVRPTKPKEIKPKAEIKGGAEGKEGGGGGGLDGMKLIAVNTVITLLICVLFVGSNFFIVQNTLTNAMKQLGTTSGDEGGDASADQTDAEAEAPGIILDLGEFILNLSDPRAKRYLKINVALELSRKETDPAPGEGGGGGHGGEGGGADPNKAILMEMEQYKPAIRDSVISILSSKTAEELSSVEGKELAKEQMKEAVDAVFAGVREVKRVSFGNFIIQ